MSESMERTVKMSRAELCIRTPGAARLPTEQQGGKRSRALAHAAHLARGEGGEFQIHPKTTRHEQGMWRLSTVTVHANTWPVAKAGTGSTSCRKRVICAEAAEVWHQKASESQLKLGFQLLSLSPKAFPVLFSTRLLPIWTGAGFSCTVLSCRRSRWKRRKCWEVLGVQNQVWQ